MKYWDVLESTDEQQLVVIKQNLRRKLPQLLEAYEYFKQNDITKTSNCSLLTNEQAVKDQLILPVLRCLGYDLDFHDHHLEVWPEVKMGQEKQAPRVDYAVYLKGETIPRVIIEAKAINTLVVHRRDYGSPSKQITSYYRAYPDAIFVPIISNGITWSIYSRVQRDGNRKDLGETPDDFTLQDLLENEDRLDLFVRILARPVIALCAQMKMEVEDYDEYVKAYPRLCRVTQNQKSVKEVNTNASQVNTTYEYYEPEDEILFDDEGDGEDEQAEEISMLPETVFDEATTVQTGATKILTLATYKESELGSLVRFGFKDQRFECHFYKRMLTSIVTALDQEAPDVLLRCALKEDALRKQTRHTTKVTQNPFAIQRFTHIRDGIYIFTCLTSIEIIETIKWFLDLYHLPHDVFWFEVSASNQDVEQVDGECTAILSEDMTSDQIVTLNQQFDCTGTKICHFWIQDQVFEASTFASMLSQTIKFLDKRSPLVLEKWSQPGQFPGLKRPLVTQDPSLVIKSKCIRDQIYINTNLSANQIIDNLRWFLIQYEVPLEAFRMQLVAR